MTIVNIKARRIGHPEYGFGVDAEELRRFFREYESNAGFKSTFAPMLAVAAGASISQGPPPTIDYMAERVDAMRPLTRTYRVLKRMDETGFRGEVVVLSRLYGHHHPSMMRPEFGDMSTVVDLTDAAIEARDQLVADEGERRADLAGMSIDRIHPDGRQALEEDLVREEARCERLVASYNRLVDRLNRTDAKRASGILLTAKQEALLESGNARLQALSAKIQASEDLQSNIEGALRSNGRVVARIGAMMATDRATTVWDAIRWKLDKPHGLKGEALAAWEAERRSFILRVRKEADELRRRAHAQFRIAKGTVQR